MKTRAFELIGIGVAAAALTGGLVTGITAGAGSSDDPVRRSLQDDTESVVDSVALLDESRHEVGTTEDDALNNIIGRAIDTLFETDALKPGLVPRDGDRFERGPLAHGGFAAHRGQNGEVRRNIDPDALANARAMADSLEARD